jgi:hypothetical protein
MLQKESLRAVEAKPRRGVNKETCEVGAGMGERLFFG